MYPNVKLRSRSRWSNHGRTNAAGANNSAARKKKTPGKNCNAFSSRRASSQKRQKKTS